MYLNVSSVARRNRYDGDKTGTICMAEMAQLFSDMGEPLDGEEVKTLMTKVCGHVPTGRR